jgi:hypothetical protein
MESLAPPQRRIGALPHRNFRDDLLAISSRANDGSIDATDGTSIVIDDGSCAS